MVGDGADFRGPEGKNEEEKSATPSTEYANDFFERHNTSIWISASTRASRSGGAHVLFLSYSFHKEIEEKNMGESLGE